MQPTERTAISRLAKRGHYDKETIYRILDEALYCTVSYAVDNHPFSIPTGFCRVADYVYLHGSVGSHMLREIEKGIPVCISVTLMDALVLAKSVFDHSVNYRSVVIFSKAEKVDDYDKKYAVLDAFTEKLIPGRWETCRKPNESEMRKTMVLGFKMDEASAKIRTGPPMGEEEDNDLPYWSGLIHLKTSREIEADEQTIKQQLPYPGYFGL